MCKECGQDHYDDEEIKVDYECDNCSKLNSIFWHIVEEHPERVIGHLTRDNRTTSSLLDEFKSNGGSYYR